MAVANKKKRKIFDGRYEIHSIVGRGSASVVYHAKNLKADNQDVALKVLIKQRYAVPRSDLLRKEALAMVSSRHKFVIRLDDFHSVGDLCYLSMEYAPYGDLRQYTTANEGKLSIAQAKLFMSQAAEALGYIHAADILHRDIKPDNILVVSPKSIRLGDFGVAILEGDDTSIEELQKGVGTFSYMAPEVLEGIRYDKQSDLYALGVAFYELLSGVHPFADAPLIQQLEIRKDGNFPELKQLVPEIPASMNTAIMELLRYDQADRIPDAEALLQLLKSRGRAKGKAADSQKVSQQENKKTGQEIARRQKQETQPDDKPATSRPKAKAKRTLRDQSEPIEKLKEVKRDRSVAGIHHSAKPKDEVSSPEAATEDEAPQESAAYEKAGDEKASSERPKHQIFSEDANTAETVVVDPQTVQEAIKQSSAQVEDIVPQPSKRSSSPSAAIFGDATPEEPTAVPAPKEAPTKARSVASASVFGAGASIEEEEDESSNNDHAASPGGEYDPFSAVPAGSPFTQSSSQKRPSKSKKRERPKNSSSQGGAPAPNAIPRQVQSGTRNRRPLVAMVVIVLGLFIGQSLLSTGGEPAVNRVVASSQDNVVENIELTREVIPSAGEPTGLAFPHIRTGVYSGQLEQIAGREKVSLVLIADRESSELTLLLGIPGWDATTIDISSIATSDTTPSKVKFSSNGFILELIAGVHQGKLVGKYINRLTETTGEWSAHIRNAGGEES